MVREVRKLVPSSHKRSEHRIKIILHPDSRREKELNLNSICISLGGGGGGGGAGQGVEIMRLVPCSHERSESRHKIIRHPDSLRKSYLNIICTS